MGWDQRWTSYGKASYKLNEMDGRVWRRIGTNFASALINAVTQRNGFESEPTMRHWKREVSLPENMVEYSKTELMRDRKMYLKAFDTEYKKFKAYIAIKDSKNAGIVLEHMKSVMFKLCCLYNQ